MTIVKSRYNLETIVCRVTWWHFSLSSDFGAYLSELGAYKIG